ncbi:MAG: hypothetical protein QOH76_2144 [Thermoleophilaceae bacterium]|nr:hypothetical protein [Thermoleophilaceae bacterium]
MRTHVWTRVLCALALAGMLVAFTGCGGDDKKSSSDSSGSGSSGSGSLADYKSGATKAANDFKNSAQAASAKVQSGTTPDDKLSGLDALKQSVTQAADDFEALNPPSNLKADNDELVSEFRSLASIIDEVKTAIQNKDQAKAAAVLPKLGQEQGKIAQTITRIQSKLGP